MELMHKQIRLAEPDIWLRREPDRRASRSAIEKQSDGITANRYILFYHDEPAKHCVPSGKNKQRDCHILTMKEHKRPFV